MHCDARSADGPTAAGAKRGGHNHTKKTRRGQAISNLQKQSNRIVYMAKKKTRHVCDGPDGLNCARYKIFKQKMCQEEMRASPENEVTLFLILNTYELFIILNVNVVVLGIKTLCI